MSGMWGAGPETPIHRVDITDLRGILTDSFKSSAVFPKSSGLQGNF